jgi:Cys-tRNA(Pro)/Cys-tRNA(Cys) deacylase
MTPAVNAAQKAKVKYKLHSYLHDSAESSYGKEAADKLGIQQGQVFKTLVVKLDNSTLAVAVTPVSSNLNLKQLAKAAASKRATMAEPNDVERVTGYVLGGVSPLGQKKRLKTYIDNSATSFSTIFVSAGRRGLEIELSPQDLKTLTNATFTAIAEAV